MHVHAPTNLRPTGVAFAAALAAIITVGILSAVVALFQSAGMPLGQLAAAEQACATHRYVSEREACVRERIAEARPSNVATAEARR